MRTLGSATSRPRSCTCPSTWPLPFCERALPRWLPSPKNAVAASRIDQRSTGNPRISRKPRPFSTSLLTRAFSTGASVGSGKSRAVMAAISAWRATSSLVAVSISAMSAAASGISQPSCLAISGPYQAAGPVCSGGSSNDMVLRFPTASGFPWKARREEVVAARQSVAFGGVDQGRADAGLERTVAGVGHHDIARLGPGTRECIGGHRRADDVVAALHDGARQMADAIEVGPGPAFGHEGAVGEVVRLDARQGESEAAMVRFKGGTCRRIERRAGGFVAAPGACRRAVAVGIAVDEPAVVVAQDISA